jgi:von Willebrand factor type A domain
MRRFRSLVLAAATAALAIAVAATPAGAGPGAQAAACVPAGNVEAIVDDSQSMSFNDPNELRRSGMQLFVNSASNAKRTLGAVEFGSDAATVFAPGLISTNRGAMVAALNTAINADNGATDYNDAFARATADNPNAQARIFLTDGQHTSFPAYGNGHRGGPPTYVVGLGIGQPGQGVAAADLLQQIATETGGRYFPDVTAASVQPVLNTVSALVGCQKPPKTIQTRPFTRDGQQQSRATAVANRTRNLDLVLNWADPDNRFRAVALAALGRGGRILATLTGKGDPAKLKVRRTNAETFQALTVRKPRGTRRLRIVIRAIELDAVEAVIAQLTQRR